MTKIRSDSLFKIEVHIFHSRQNHQTVHYIYSVNVKKYGNIKPRYLVCNENDQCIYVSDEASWYTYIYIKCTNKSSSSATNIQFIE